MRILNKIMGFLGYVPQKEYNIIEDDMLNFSNTLVVRKSCRRYVRSAPIEPMQLFLIEWAISRAPYASGGPRMECIVIRDIERRRQLREACMGQQYVEDASCSFVFCGTDVGVQLRQGFSKFVFDCAFAAAQAHLMASSLGLGSCIIGNFIPDRVKEILKTDLRPTLILIVGVPTDEK